MEEYQVNWFIPSDYLFATRQVLLVCITLTIWPMEIVFDSIENELLARGHHLRSDM